MHLEQRFNFLENLELLFLTELSNRVDDGGGHGAGSNERCVVDVGECRLRKLAIHPVRHTTMTRNAVAKVLDVERALEPAREEASEGSDEARKDGQNDRVELERRPGN